MKKYAILFAMKDEAESLIKELSAKLIKDDYFEIYQKDNIYIAISKVGLINATSCFTYVNQKFAIDCFINAGLVGTFSSDLNLLEPVIIKQSYLGNADARGFGYQLGQIPGMKAYYLSDEKLLNSFKSFKQVDICSSDIFINSQEKVDQIITPISNSISVFDMECFGFYQAAYIFKKPIIALKVVSDHINNGSNEEQFNQILKQGSLKISELILEIIKK
ncbi:5'-methylthioadenosine/S-adenosylhomocysteine nucleosidase family protein [Spiroplasma cantharicola]|uniref:5'-methylthioadenosine/S-adenosylhomocysteine nucleosidase n=1 Tax=Spiroplasma cantharicola TaxID=362837 RepID=A0A0M4K1T0_9MOLU|nr:5'-methylthioadenosine/S-adenosylhomocysteine nucleosidase [Spiroplasma cantharicola]ALD66612.1 5'-methylthioadenosine/S-adenosylhomocysteine nucleosidase [Spiroplasma cantharicola]